MWSLIFIFVLKSVFLSTTIFIMKQPVTQIYCHSYLYKGLYCERMDLTWFCPDEAFFSFFRALRHMICTNKWTGILYYINWIYGQFIYLISWRIYHSEVDFGCAQVAIWLLVNLPEIVIFAIFEISFSILDLQFFVTFRRHVSLNFELLCSIPFGELVMFSGHFTFLSTWLTKCIKANFDFYKSIRILSF